MLQGCSGEAFEGVMLKKERRGKRGKELREREEIDLVWPVHSCGSHPS